MGENFENPPTNLKFDKAYNHLVIVLYVHNTLSLTCLREGETALLTLNDLISYMCRLRFSHVFIYCSSFNLSFYFYSVAAADLDTESRIVILEKIMHDRMADLEKIVHEQKDEIYQLRQEVTLLRSQVGQNIRQTKTPKQISSRTKFADDDADADVPLNNLHVEHSVHEIKKGIFSIL